MDNRPRFHWRRRSVFVTVFLVVMIASAVSVLAATGSTSGKHYYACVAGQFKTLNLTTADATCPKGQRKISFGEGERGAKGGAGAAGARGVTGAIGAKGATGAAGPEGKAGPAGSEGKQGPAGTGGGAPGPEGKEGKSGPAGPAGAEGKDGKEGPSGNSGPIGPQGFVGPEGPVGPQGVPGPEGPAGSEGPPGPAGPAGNEGPAGTGTIVYAASSGTPVVPTTLAGGLTGEVAVLPLDGDVAATVSGGGPTLNLTGGGGQVVPAQTFPIDETIQSITVYTSTTAALNLIGTMVTVSAQLYESTTPDNTFTPVPGARATAAPPFTGIVAIGEISNGITTGLSIPVAAGTRGVIVISLESAGVGLINSVPMYASASISATGA